MSWAEVGKAVSSVAPVLAGILGGPVGAVASAAGALVSAVLGEDADPATVEKKLRDNPELLVKIKELEAKRQSDLLAFRHMQDRMALENMQDARSREVKLARAGHGAAWATSLVALVVTCGFFVMLRDVLASKDVSQAALLLLGTLGSAFGAVVNYYLGSSLGSARKDAVVREKK